MVPRRFTEEAVHEARIGYLAKMFPRISETFILKEVLALRAHGLPVRIYSLMPPTRDARMHAAAAALLSEVRVLPQPLGGSWLQFLSLLRKAYAIRPGVTLRELLRLLSRPSRRGYRRLFRALALAELLRGDRVGHLHAAWAHTPASVARIAGRLTSIPWSMAGHAKDIHLSNPGSLAKKLASARFSWTCTRTNLELLRRLAPHRPDSAAGPVVECYYHGVDVDYFAPAGSPAVEETEHPASAGDAPRTSRRASSSPSSEASTAPLILSVGRLVPKKGFDLLIEAAAMLKERGVDFRLEIVGEGPLRDRIEAAITERGLRERVTLRGMLTLDEVREAYHRADFVVLASRVTPEGDRDGIPNTLAEAMACGRPVVATRLSSIQELVIHGVTGLLVPTEDPKALADAMEQLLRDRSLRQQLSSGARSRVMEVFDARPLEQRICERLQQALRIEKVLYLSADRGVPVRGGKGASVHVRAVVKALREHRIDVHLVTARPGPGDGPDPGAPITVATVGGRWKRRIGRLAHRLRGGVPLERAILRVLDNVPIHRAVVHLARDWHPDLIYERYALTAVAGSLVARRSGIPHIVEVNAPLADEEARFRGLRWGWLARRAEGWILRRADRVVVVSQALADHARRLGVQEKRILVLPNAVDGLLFHPNRDGRSLRARLDLSGSYVVGFSGTLKPWHGLHHLMRAAAEAIPRVPNLRLLVIGDGPERERLTALAGDLGLAQKIHFTGNVPHEEVGAYLAACDVLVAPYGPLENLWFSPLKVAEYVAIGRPVIASAVGQLSELYGPECGVVLVPPGGESALADALVDLGLDAERRAQLARRSAHAPARTWDGVVGRMLAAAEAARRGIWGWSG